MHHLSDMFCMKKLNMQSKHIWCVLCKQEGHKKGMKQLVWGFQTEAAPLLLQLVLLLIRLPFPHYCSLYGFACISSQARRHRRTTKLSSAVRGGVSLTLASMLSIAGICALTGCCLRWAPGEGKWCSALISESDMETERLQRETSTTDSSCYSMLFISGSKKTIGRKLLQCFF